MSRPKPHLLKRVLIDALGIALIIFGFLIGWIPGPGGIFFYLAGLGLLASNHEWAARWLHHLKRHADNLGDLIFRDHKWLKIGYDIAAIAAIAGGIYLISLATHSVVQGLLIWLIALGLTVFLFNRKRVQRINRFVRAALRWEKT